MDTAVRTNDPAEQIVALLESAEAEADLGIQARTTLHAQSAAGHEAEAWVYEEIAEACENAAAKLLAEATAMYKGLDVPLQRRADALASGYRYAHRLR